MAPDASRKLHETDNDQEISSRDLIRLVFNSNVLD